MSMNNTFNNPNYYAHKKRLQSEDLEVSSLGLPRKKFISEENFAKEMAAMSLDPNLQLQQQQLQQQHQIYHFYNNRLDTSFSPSPIIQRQDKNVVRIDHLSDDEDDDMYSMDPQLQSNNAIYMELNGKKAIVDGNLNGLPLELRPGEHKPRIPDFVLENSKLTDPRDKIAYKNILKAAHGNKSVHIEVLNDPSAHFTPTSMDID